MAFYQCFKTKARDVYCSSTKYRSHAEGSEWVRACMEHYGIKGNDLHGKPYESDDQPDDATIWPD